MAHAKGRSKVAVNRQFLDSGPSEKSLRQTLPEITFECILIRHTSFLNYVLNQCHVGILNDIYHEPLKFSLQFASTLFFCLLQIINKLILILWFLPKFNILIYQRTSYMMNVAHAHTD
jgi:hypothetical protein